ncbi:hypothetical protein QQX98_011432 [Neonectria punicea]|uniref:Uncharacterized protein n=1 Tax=Neonectria punicea TaxID=979145 RepID=A0ABR1GLS1_9HYPO
MSLRERYSVQSHCLKVSGREQGKCNQREPSMGKVEWVQPEEVENTLVNILKSVQSAVVASSTSQGPWETSDPPTLALVGFDLHLEFRMLSTRYPRLLIECFSSWVDLQEVVKDVSTDLENRAPGMRDTLIAFGFRNGALAIIPQTTAHSSGTDTVRMIALLINTLAFPCDENLEIMLSPRRNGPDKD